MEEKTWRSDSQEQRVLKEKVARHRQTQRGVRQGEEGEDEASQFSEKQIHEHNFVAGVAQDADDDDPLEDEGPQPSSLPG